VAHAASGETIRLAAACQYVLTAALPVINGNLSIEGSGATLERSGAAGTPDFSILTVNSAGFSVSNLNFRNGSSAIDMSQNASGIPTHSITVTHWGFTGNAGDALNLGGYYTGQGTVTDSSFTHNGAAISDDGFTLTVTGSTFADNGTGIYTQEMQTPFRAGVAGATTVTGSTFTRTGVGIECSPAESCAVTLTDSVFRFLRGGISLNGDVGGELTANDDVFTDNTATGGGGRYLHFR
jgi:hypothetical protein